MKITDIIDRKKHGFALSEEEIKFFIDGIMNNSIEDYQTSALLMAIYFKGMNLDETTLLTKYMAESGQILDLSDISDDITDKHSTGGVGDKITIILLPILAAAGLYCAKLSGRGLGHTGGTIDKLESIPGFNTDLSIQEFKTLVKEQKTAIAAQTLSLAPADGKLYALRDVTATVDIIPLIASSVVSKKIASGAKHII
ncbi:MAG: thymidine phosphorylase, partial [Candidatus Gastranaerophilales bacterium]|nr:thymidine phosphorylase [Candidatus Gastranaerophilales bacterium]